MDNKYFDETMGSDNCMQTSALRPGVDFSIERFAVRPTFSHEFVAKKLGIVEQRNWIERSLWTSLSEKRTRNRPKLDSMVRCHLKTRQNVWFSNAFSDKIQETNFSNIHNWISGKCESEIQQLKSRNIWKPHFLKIWCLLVQFSKGQAIVLSMAMVSTIQKLGHLKSRHFFWISSVFWQSGHLSRFQI